MPSAGQCPPILVLTEKRKGEPFKPSRQLIGGKLRSYVEKGEPCEPPRQLFGGKLRGLIGGKPPLNRVMLEAGKW